MNSSVFKVEIIGDHPLNKNFEYVQFNPDLKLIRCKTDGLYQAKSIADCLNPSYKTRNWFKEKENQKYIQHILQQSKIKDESIIHHVKYNVPEELKGHYINEIFIYLIAFDCNEEYKKLFMNALNEYRKQNKNDNKELD